LCGDRALSLNDLAPQALDDRSGGIGDDLPGIAFGQSDQGGLAEHFVYGRQLP
jgi:DNA-directed RNA polymerase subunit K/omega